MMKKHSALEELAQDLSQLGGGRSGIGIQVVSGSGHLNTTMDRGGSETQGGELGAQGHGAELDQRQEWSPHCLIPKPELPATLGYCRRLVQKRLYLC